MRHTHRGGGAWWFVMLLLGVGWPGAERSITEVNGHISCDLLGDGTGVIIAILDSGP